MTTPPNDLTGTVAIVSGASRGLGRTYALALARAGAKVLATARTADGNPEERGSLAEVAATAKSEGLEIVPFRVDLANPAEIDAAVNHCLECFGRIDSIVNNAVWYVQKADVLDVEDKDWINTYSVNVVAPYKFMQAAAPHMEKAGGGSIINLTSIAARYIEGAVTSMGFPTYSVTKAALERLTSYAGVELQDRGIAVNAISPGNAEYYMRDGRDPDMAFWGWPVVHLAAQRAPDGLTGRIVHTYEFGSAWGPEYDSPPEWDERLHEMLANSDKPAGYFAQR